MNKLFFVLKIKLKINIYGGENMTNIVEFIKEQFTDKDDNFDNYDKKGLDGRYIDAFEKWLRYQVKQCEKCKESLNGKPDWNKHCCYPCKDVKFVVEKVLSPQLKQEYQKFRK